MNKLMMSAAALAVCLGSSAAFAQDTDHSTSVSTSQDGTTQTKTDTMKTNDGYKQYRRTVTSTKHYNAGAYMAPSGYTYSRYDVGQRVPSVLLGVNLELGNYSNYALAAPPDGLTWIRVGNDALLIDEGTGEIVQADYGLFSS